MEPSKRLAMSEPGQANKLRSGTRIADSDYVKGNLVDESRNPYILLARVDSFAAGNL